jgi:hypothetical protein
MVVGILNKLTGMSSPVVRKFWNIKLWVEALPFAGAMQIIAKLLHAVNPIIPAILPKPIIEIGNTMDNHVTMTLGDVGDDNLDRILE